MPSCAVKAAACSAGLHRRPWRPCPAARRAPLALDRSRPVPLSTSAQHVHLGQISRSAAHSSASTVPCPPSPPVDDPPPPHAPAPMQVLVLVGVGHCSSFQRQENPDGVVVVARQRGDRGSSVDGLGCLV